MDVLLNQRLVKRSRIFTRICFFLFLVFLTIGLILLVYPPTNRQNRALDLLISAGFLLIGYLFLRINMSMSSRWEAKPRIDELLTSALKGLPAEFTLAHYVTYNAHILVGPKNVYLLDTTDFSGEVYFNETKNHWAIKRMGNAAERLIKREHFPNTRKTRIQALKDWGKMLAHLKKTKSKAGFENIPEPEYLMVLLNEKSSVPQVDAFAAFIRLDKLKDVIRKRSGPSAQPTEVIKKFLFVLEACVM
jgi:hypothetical protein